MNAITVIVARGLSSLSRTIIVRVRGLPVSDHYPRFENHASCSDHNPDLWFPQEKSGSRNWTRTPDAIRARTICASCPARQECLDYSLNYSGLYGIWAGLDWYERREIQDERGIQPIQMLDTFVSSLRNYDKEEESSAR